MGSTLGPESAISTDLNGVSFYTPWNARRRLRRGFGIGLSPSAAWSFMFWTWLSAFRLGVLILGGSSWFRVPGAWEYILNFDCDMSFGCGRRLLLGLSAMASLWPVSGSPAACSWSSRFLFSSTGQVRDNKCGGQVWNDDLCTCMRRKMQHMIVQQTLCVVLLDL